tara:strand:+ start:892 stop:1152 length:261 start_codon:yes stop_codon:yes gene_type:complete
MENITLEEYYKNKSKGKYTDHMDHGMAYDRGMADSWYDRAIQPHYWTDGSYGGDKIEREYMTNEEVEAYMAGYMINEDEGGKKEWD